MLKISNIHRVIQFNHLHCVIEIIPLISNQLNILCIKCQQKVNFFHKTFFYLKKVLYIPRPPLTNHNNTLFVSDLN